MRHSRVLSLAVTASLASCTPDDMSPPGNEETGERHESPGQQQPRTDPDDADGEGSGPLDPLGGTACDAPEPEYLYEGSDTLHAVAVSGDTLVFGGNAGLFAMPTDGSGNPRALWEADPDLYETVGELEVRDGLVYFAMRLDAQVVPLAGGEAESWGSMEGLLLDGDDLYAYSQNIGCVSEEPIEVYAGDVRGVPDRTIAVPCLQHADVFEGVVVASDWSEEDYRLLRLDDGGKTEVLATEPEMGAVQLTGAYAYYARSRDFDSDTLMRVPIEGGNPEALGRTLINAWIGLEDGFYANDLLGGSCLRWYGDDGGVEVLATVAETQALALDDDYLYGVTYGGAVYRVAR